MAENAEAVAGVAPVQEIQQGWNELNLRVRQLEAQRTHLEQENKSLRFLLERAIEHRQKSHGELVLLLTSLVSKLPMNDVGGIVAKLVEHNTNVSQYLAALIKGTAEADLPQPELLKTLDHVRHDILEAVKTGIRDLLQTNPPLETEMLEALGTEPGLFFTPRFLRANRGFLKGQVPRERIVREFGEAALALFNDMTTDPKLNPRPKPEEISLSFKPEFESVLEANPSLLPEKRGQLVELFHRVQRSKSNSSEGRLQKNLFLRLSFLLELLHYYDNSATEAPDVIFAQRLPALLEQILLAGQDERIEEALLKQAEELLAHVINPDHRHAVINNMGKGGGPARTLKYVLKLRAEKPPEADQVIQEFLKHVLAVSNGKPTAEIFLALVRYMHPAMQPVVVRAIFTSDRMGHSSAEAIARSLASSLGIPDIDRGQKTEQTLAPEVDRQLAWERIKDMITRRADTPAIVGAIRERLHSHYDAEEMKQSWVALTEAEPIKLIKVFCQLPYLADGKTDPIARTVLETYVTRLLHEKYAGTYAKVVNSLKNMFRAKADSPTLLNFFALVRWIDPEAATRLSSDVGMPAHAP